MRCTVCHSYIPEGLAEPGTCPQCGRAQTPVEPSFEKEPQPAPLVTAETPRPQKIAAELPSANAFAPYFTIRTRLSFGPRGAAGGLEFPEAQPGSISFGPDGFSIVSDDGKRWEKLCYRDLGPASVGNGFVELSIRDVESALVLHHPWLPAWLKRPRTARAAVFVELLGRVRRGLTPSEIQTYQSRLQ